MPMKPKEMIRLLKKNGFIKISQNGSHGFTKKYSKKLFRLEPELTYQFQKLQSDYCLRH